MNCQGSFLASSVGLIALTQQCGTSFVFCAVLVPWAAVLSSRRQQGRRGWSQLKVRLQVSLQCIMLSSSVCADTSPKILPILTLKLPPDKGLDLHHSSPLPWHAISLQPPFLSTRSRERPPGATLGALSLEKGSEAGGESTGLLRDCKQSCGGSNSYQKTIPNKWAAATPEARSLCCCSPEGKDIWGFLALHGRAAAPGPLLWLHLRTGSQGEEGWGGRAVLHAQTPPELPSPCLLLGPELLLPLRSPRAPSQQ